MSDLWVVERLRHLESRFENNAHESLNNALDGGFGTDFAAADAALFNFEQAERTRRVIAFFENLSGKARASTGGGE
jgi:hypothetical protein